MYVHGGPSAHSEDEINAQIQYYTHRGFFVLDPNYRGSTGYGYEFEDGTQRHYQGDRIGGYDNPYWVINNISFQDNTNRMVGNLKLEYEPIDWITISYNIGTDWYHRESNNFFEKGSNEWYNGLVAKQHSFTRDFNSDLIINIKKYFSDDFSATLILGQNL